ncbi:solute carrier family 31 (copper transporter), member 1 [[Emmonsia] crescens]|uniref:Copper transport protein n=1 Tax=[Emmonsia] crescens TaxID=73230 RepID=A0A2B7Z0D8_9EURO|nr:solute carrier family 31 (copper transporter), member 1 [Emmonsia crescens]
MDMTMSMTHGAPMPTSTAASSMSGMGGMGGMRHNGCKISMLWNWNVINACFISSSWRITSRGMFAGSCIGVIVLVMCLEFLRRAGHEYDKYIAGKSNLFTGRVNRSSVSVSPKSTSSGLESPDEAPLSPRKRKRAARPTLLQHTGRSLLHMVQFGVAYFVMLLAMYYNGYIIISILIGSFLGAFVFSWKSEEEKLVS